jgi:hypothetical protein
MSSCIGRLDLAMSILETLNDTIGNIEYGPTRPYLANVVYLARSRPHNRLWNLECL